MEMHNWNINVLANKQELPCKDFDEQLISVCKRMKNEKVSFKCRFYYKSVSSIELTVSSKANCVEIRPKVFLNPEKPENIEYVLRMDPLSAYTTILSKLTEMMVFIQEKFMKTSNYVNMVDCFPDSLKNNTFPAEKF